MPFFNAKYKVHYRSIKIIISCTVCRKQKIIYRSYLNSKLKGSELSWLSGKMHMVNFFRKNTNRETKLVAPVTGKTIDLSKVPDEVFAGKLVGDGIAIEPSGDVIVAPADGELTLVFNTLHAFALTLDNGAEILVHIGIDTVALNGEGFEQLAVAGTTVKAGTPIIKINRDLILNKGFSLITPVLITNMEIVKELRANIDKGVTAGQDEVISFGV